MNAGRLSGLFAIAVLAIMPDTQAAEVSIGPSQPLDEVEKAQDYRKDRWNRLSHCTIMPDNQVDLVQEEENRMHWRVEIRKGGRLVRAISPEPQGDFRTDGWGVNASVACDPELPRIYFADPFVGVVVAMDLEGRQLWKHPLEGFRAVPFEKESTLKGDSIASSRFDMLSGLFPSGVHLLVELRERRGPFRLVVFHRSGRKVASYGPSNWYVGRSSPGGWVVYDSRGVSGWVPPETKAQLTLLHDKTEDLIRHVFAWLTPTKGTFELRMCTGSPIESIQAVLGEEYDEQIAREAQGIWLSLGTHWIEEQFSNPVLVEAARSYRANDRKWTDEYWRTLLSVGLDAEISTRWSKIANE